jgi:hypothetical protein
VNDANQRVWVSPIHFIDIDWRYQDHRFCRDSVEEVERKDPDTWLFHSPVFTLLEGQEQNQTYLDLAMENNPITWTPGEDGDPNANLSIPVNSTETTYDPQLVLKPPTNEGKVRTFHPKPAGYTATADAIKWEIYRDEKQKALKGIKFHIMCLGDFSALGEGYEMDNEERYGFIPYLHAMLRRRENFDDEAIAHDFIGSQKTGFIGDVGHEIYPKARKWAEVTGWASGTEFFKRPIGKVIPIMMGAKDLQNQRPISDICNDVNDLLDAIYKADDKAVVLLGSVPMMGDTIDDGSEFWGAQRAIIQFNGELAKIANYETRARNRKVTFVHLSATQRKRVNNNPYVPNKEGYHRIAFDFLNGLLHTNERGFFNGDEWTTAAAIPNTPSYNLKPLVDNESTNGVKCH